MATTRNVMGMVTPIPRIAWDALVEMYGTDGSPVVNITALESEKMACSICAVSCHILLFFSGICIARMLYILTECNWCSPPYIINSKKKLSWTREEDARSKTWQDWTLLSFLMASFGILLELTGLRSGMHSKLEVIYFDRPMFYWSVYSSLHDPLWLLLLILLSASYFALFYR